MNIKTKMLQSQIYYETNTLPAGRITQEVSNDVYFVVVSSIETSVEFDIGFKLNGRLGRSFTNLKFAVDSKIASYEY